MDEASVIPEVSFVYLSGPMKGKRLHATGGVIRIGSHPASDIAFTDAAGERVAAMHAKISHTSGRFVLYDNEDEFPTYHNEKRVDQAELEPGDVLQFGTDGPLVRFEVVEAPSEVEETIIRKKSEQTRVFSRYDSGIAFREAQEKSLHLETTKIGRDAANDIVLNHPQVSQ